MPRAFDRHVLPISNDPNQGLEFHPQSVLKQAAGMWQTIIDSILEAAENLIKELIQKLIGIAVDPEQALDELWDLLTGWVGDIPVIGDILAKINEVFSGIFGGIDFTGTLPTPEEVWAGVVETFIQPILDVFDQIKAGLTSLLGPIFGGIDFSGTLPTPEEVWQQVVSTLIEPLNILLGPNSPLNLANAFGRLGLGSFGGGLPLMALTTAVPNELEPFTAASVPTSDGWSFNSAEDAAQVVCDGSPKTLYLKSGVIKVEAGQPINTSVPVKYSGVVSGAGQTIRYVLETFTSDDGSGTATPVTVGAVANPSGTITSPVTVGDTSWDIPAGVQSVRPTLVVDGVTAGTVFWKNTPQLKRILAGPLADGLPAAIQARIDDFNELLSNLLTNPAAVLGDIPRALVDGLEAWWDGITAKTVNLTSGGFFDAGKLQNITGTIAQSLVTGLTSSLNTLNDFIQDVVDAIIGAIRGIPFVGGAIADLVTEVTGLKSTADNALSDAATATTTANTAQTSADSAQSSANTISEIISIPHIVPSWQGYLADDVSFPIAQIDGTLTSSLNKLYLIPVTTQQDRAYTALKFGLTGTSMTNFYVGIYFMDPATGNIAKILDCGDVKSSLSSTYNQQMITLPAVLSATRGDTYFVGLLQVGGTAGSLHRWSNATNFSTGLYPQFIGEEATGTFSSLPASVTAGNVIAGARIWAALGDVTPILAPGSAFYADGFNRANAAQLSTPWTSRYTSGAGNIGINGNAFGPQGGASPGANVYTYNSKVATVSHEIQADVASMPTSTSVTGALLLRGNTSGCLYVSVRYVGSNTWVAEIRTHTSYSLGSNLLSGTVRASGPTGAYNGTTIRCTAVGNTYTLYRSGIEIAQWIDSGGVFTYDGTSREVGIAGTANSGGYSLFDNWQAKDI